ncbi:TIGR03757 family integrating conjugative element protein [Salinisphaera hydrothermalis]|nr:TIGR03757 family integrating conjugative element protein [Salinisphaera hydrothermalis]
MRRIISTLMGCALLAAAGSAAAQVEVFTVAGAPVTHVPDGVDVIEIDKPARLDKQLSEGLPRDKAAAAKAVQKRLSGFKQAYGSAYDGLLRAWRLGVERVPAVVVDGQYVVYGQPDVKAAVAEIRNAQEDGS